MAGTHGLEAAVAGEGCGREGGAGDYKLLAVEGPGRASSPGAEDGFAIGSR